MTVILKIEHPYQMKLSSFSSILSLPLNQTQTVLPATWDLPEALHCQPWKNPAIKIYVKGSHTTWKYLEQYFVLPYCGCFFKLNICFKTYWHPCSGVWAISRSDIDSSKYDFWKGCINANQAYEFCEADMNRQLKIFVVKIFYWDLVRFDVKCNLFIFN